MFKKYASAEILYEEAERLGLHPKWETSDGLFSIENDKKTYFVYYTKLFFNTQLGSILCRDKHLTRVVLDKFGMPNIPYLYSNKRREIFAFVDKYKVVVQKPVLGEKAQNVVLIKAASQISFNSLEEIILEKYVEGIEYRCLVLKGKVIAIQKKILNPSKEYPWRKYIENLDKDKWNLKMTRLSEKISSVFKLGFVAADFILDKDYKLWILEINSMPGLFSFHNPDAGKKLNVASVLIKEILRS